MHCGYAEYYGIPFLTKPKFHGDFHEIFMKRLITVKVASDSMKFQFETNIHRYILKLDNLHDEVTVAVGYCVKNPGIFTVCIFYLSDERKVLSSFKHLRKRCISWLEFKIMKIGNTIYWLNFFLTHWGRVTHICVSKLTIIGSANGLSPGRRQAIIWTNAGILLIRPLGTNFNEILIEMLTFSFMKMCLKVSSAKCVHFVSASMC